MAVDDSDARPDDSVDAPGQSRADEAPRLRGEGWRSLVENVPDIILTVDRSGKILFINRTVSGFTVEDTIGRSVYDYIPPEHHGLTRMSIAKVFQTGDIVSFETAAAGPGGIMSWYSTRLGPIKDGDEVIAVMQISTDITEHRKAEKALQESEERFRNIYEESPIGIVLYDANGRLLNSNRSLLEIFGISDIAEVEGFELFRDPHVTDEMKDMLTRGKSVKLETTYDFEKIKALNLYRTSKSGTIHLDVLITPLNPRGDDISSGYLLQIQDITERKRAEEELMRHRENLEDMIEERTRELKDVNDLLRREIAERRRVDEELRGSEARYRGIVEDQTEMICRFLPDAIITFVNDAYCRCFGKRREELIGRSFFPMISREDRESVKRHIASLSLEKPVDSHDQLSTIATGELKWQHWTNRAIFDHEGRLVEYQAVGRDIDQRKKAEEALESRNRELGALNEINVAINSAGESTEILRNIMKIIIDYCGAEYAGLYEIDGEIGELRLIATCGVPEEIQKKVQRVVAGVDRVRDIVNSNGVVVVEEDVLVPDAEYYDEIKEYLGIKRTMAFVSRSRGRTSYLTFIGSQVDENVSVEVRNFLNIAGNQLGIAFERLKLLRTLEGRERDLRDLTARLMNTIEEERRRMALSLHDEMGQSLISLNLEFNLLEERALSGNDKIRESLKKIREQLKSITENTRQISYSLHPSMLEDLGLLPALQWYVDKFIVSDELKVDIETSGFDEKIPSQVGLTLYRIAQESLTNVSRHSDADHVSLKLTKGYPRVIMMIEDNGKGFSPEEEIPGKGLGIVGMRERIERLGGDFQIKSAPGKGTRIRVTLPLEVDDGNQD